METTNQQRTPDAKDWHVKSARCLLLLVLCIVEGVCGCSPDESLQHMAAAEAKNEAIWCPDYTMDLPVATTAPWGAVGYLNNGCTATLIDRLHILAAAHCFTTDWDGEWQSAPSGGALKFYPNFHPWRVTPPRYEIERVIVGTRTQDTVPRFGPSDWAIAKLKCSSIPGGGSFCPPVTDFPNLPIAAIGSSPEVPLQMDGYVRHPAYFSPDCNCAPYADEFSSCAATCPSDTLQGFPNAWWQFGKIDPSCTIDSNTGYGTTDDYLQTDCSTDGGNSGSPLLWESAETGWTVVGVESAGPPTGASACLPWDGTYPSVGPAAERFIDAPRFATNVALARYVDGSARTQAFVVDRQSAKVRRRYRKSTSVNDGFTNYETFGWVVRGIERIAAMNLTNSRPQVVVTDAGRLQERYYDSNTSSWVGWQSMDTPGYVLDIDHGYGRGGEPYVYAVTDSPGSTSVWRRTRTSHPYGPWGPWEQVLNESTEQYKKITSVKRHGDAVQVVFMLTQAGQIHYAYEPFPRTAANTFAMPPGVTMIDIDAAWAYTNEVILVGIDSNGSMWIRQQAGTSGDQWFNWSSFDPPLLAPQIDCSGGPPRDLTSVTASRLQEEDGAPYQTVPVVFVTDAWGNVYYTTYRTGPSPPTSQNCDGWTGGAFWQPWRSFYHSRLWDDYN